MDAETMIEKLEAVRAVGYDDAVILGEVIAALRAQAKAEPVYQLCVDEDAGGIGGVSWIDVEKNAYDLACDLGNCLPPRILYTAPPPDHAEALAEALEEIMSYEGGAESPLEDQYVVDRAQSALTRYKERTNG